MTGCPRSLRIYLFTLCVMKQNSQFTPLFFLDKSKLLELNGIDQPSQLSSLESYELKSKLTHMPSLANVFNNFFVNVSIQVSSEIPRTKKSPLDYLKNRNMNSFFISPVTHSDIEDIIISLKNGKSTDPFSIPVKLLKLVKSDIYQGL